MTQVFVVLCYLVTPIVLLLLGGTVGTLAERRRVSSRLRKLPISQEAFEYYLVQLGLDENPLDRRTPGEE